MPKHHRANSLGSSHSTVFVFQHLNRLRVSTSKPSSCFNIQTIFVFQYLRGEVLMKRANVFMTSLVGLVMVASVQAHAFNIIASAHGDFVAGSSDGSPGSVAATGTGTWNYLSSDAENPTLAPNLDLLEWSTGNIRYQPEALGLSEPLVGDFGSELFIHPGQNSPKWGVIRWIVGAGEGGLVNVSGLFRKLPMTNGIVIGTIFYDGTELDSVTLAGDDTVGEDFDFDLMVSDGSILDFVIGPGSGAAGDSSGLNITVTTIPEPSGIALLLCSGMGLIGFQRRRKQA
jgi:hypothetical protein